jgi:hypothetical protein
MKCCCICDQELSDIIKLVTKFSNVVFLNFILENNVISDKGIIELTLALENFKNL